MYITYIGKKNKYLADTNKTNRYQSYLEEKISENNSYEDFITDAKCLEILEKLAVASC